MNFDLYKNTLEYPAQSQFATTYWYRAGAVVAKRIADGEIEILDARVGNGIELGACTKETVIDKDAFRDARAAYSAESGRLTELFKRDLFAELGIVGHPKAEKLYSIAWDMGHSSGFSEIETVAWDLLPLIQD